MNAGVGRSDTSATDGGDRERQQPGRRAAAQIGNRDRGDERERGELKAVVGSKPEESGVLFRASAPSRRSARRRAKGVKAEIVEEEDLRRSEKEDDAGKKPDREAEEEGDDVASRASRGAAAPQAIQTRKTGATRWRRRASPRRGRRGRPPVRALARSGAAAARRARRRPGPEKVRQRERLDDGEPRHDQSACHIERERCDRGEAAQVSRRTNSKTMQPAAAAISAERPRAEAQVAPKTLSQAP